MLSMVNVVLCLPAGNQQVDAIHVTQLERDTVLVCLDREYNPSASASAQMGSKVVRNRFHSLLWFLSSENLKIVNLQGRLKSNKKLASELSFDFCIGSVGKLQNRMWFRDGGGGEQNCVSTFKQKYKESTSRNAACSLVWLGF